MLGLSWFAGFICVSADRLPEFRLACATYPTKSDWEDPDVYWHQLRETLRNLVHFQSSNKLLEFADQVVAEGRPLPNITQSTCLLGSLCLALLFTLHSVHNLQTSRKEASSSVHRLVLQASSIDRFDWASLFYSSWPIFALLDLLHQWLSPRAFTTSRILSRGVPFPIIKLAESMPSKVAPHIRKAFMLLASLGMAAGHQTRVRYGLLSVAFTQTLDSAESLFLAGANLGSANRLAACNLTSLGGVPLWQLLNQLQTYHLSQAGTGCPQGSHALRTRSHADDAGSWMCIPETGSVVGAHLSNIGLFPDCQVIADQLLDHELKQGQDCLVVDTGANIGSCTILWASMGAHVVAFEPLPSNAALLRASVRNNGLESQVSVIQSAAADKATKRRLQVGDDDALGRILHSRVHKLTRQSEHTELGVAAARIDSVVVPDELSGQVCDVVSGRCGLRPCLLKTDCEGGDFEALKGAANLLPLLRAVVVEANFNFLVNASKDEIDSIVRTNLDMLDFLAREGFQMQRLSNRAHLEAGARCKIMVRASFVLRATETVYMSDRPALLDAHLGCRDTCECMALCDQQINQGCRCWSYQPSTGLCRLMRSHGCGWPHGRPRDGTKGGIVRGNMFGRRFND